MERMRVGHIVREGDRMGRSRSSPMLAELCACHPKHRLNRGLPAFTQIERYNDPFDL